MRLALYEPDIPQNTGTILRLAACLGVPVDVIGPTGFDMTDKALRRAGARLSRPRRHRAARELCGIRDRARARGSPPRPAHHPRPRRPIPTSPSAPSDTLLLGRESAGVPQAVHDLADARLRIPIRPGLRSLNVAVAAAMVLGEALRQTGERPPSP